MQKAKRQQRQQGKDAAKEKKLVKHKRQATAAAALHAENEEVEDMPQAQRGRKQSGSRQVPHHHATFSAVTELFLSLTLANPNL